MLVDYLSIALLGWAACNATYYAIHQHQMVPVLASALATLAVIVMSQALPETWEANTAVWQSFWFGCSFCGMNNNRWVNRRSLQAVWLLYMAGFAVAYVHLPLPGGFLGTLALLASGTWILASHCLSVYAQRLMMPSK